MWALCFSHGYIPRTGTEHGPERLVESRQEGGRERGMEGRTGNATKGLQTWEALFGSWP